MQDLQKRLQSHQQFVEAFKGLASAAPLETTAMNKRVCTGVGISGQVGEKKGAEELPREESAIANSDKTQASSTDLDQGEEASTKKLKASGTTREEVSTKKIKASATTKTDFKEKKALIDEATSDSESA